MKNISILLVVILTLTGCLGHRVPKPKSDADFTYKIGWWPYQDELTIDSFSVAVVDSKLNLFNSKSLVRLSIVGKIVGSKNWEPRIDNVHISEKVIVGGNFTNSIAEICITPIVEVEQCEKYNEEIIPFDLTQELVIQSMGWGSNTYKFVCGNVTNELFLRQLK